ncbi:unnamed protein product [Phytophthora fragariaefolia]|uniref:Unnamed protein product n=1 Tax=Phytophthora fragariaefolia TaxID=1490495 RepID=A0A9W7CIJ7_9STRA|nr:unnamed protein product [Phytophthora fragariaefolia]
MPGNAYVHAAQRGLWLVAWNSPLVTVFTKSAFSECDVSSAEIAKNDDSAECSIETAVLLNSSWLNVDNAGNAFTLVDASGTITTRTIAKACNAIAAMLASPPLIPSCKCELLSTVPARRLRRPTAADPSTAADDHPRKTVEFVRKRPTQSRPVSQRSHHDRAHADPRSHKRFGQHGGKGCNFFDAVTSAAKRDWSPLLPMAGFFGVPPINTGRTPPIKPGAAFRPIAAL